MNDQVIQVYIAQLAPGGGWAGLLLCLAVFAVKAGIVTVAVVVAYSNIHAIKTGADQTESAEAVYQRRFEEWLRSQKPKDG